MHLSYKEQGLLLLTLSCWFCTILSCQPGQLCQWTSWHPWAACNTTCGSGVQSRWRGVCCDDQSNLDFLGCIAHCNLSRTQYREYQTCNDVSMCTLDKRHTFLSGGAVAGIVTGVIGIVVGALLLIVFIKRWKRKQNRRIRLVATVQGDTLSPRKKDERGVCQ
ncbi:SCO-spondin-like [Crassostrea angulata]|uniref:SCO-spondin-like n=1 Tax=Magallana angulata TaxID=2784310 RepID=UPI0022B0AA81|nr:SCO-spondin-like [Crassostrea angulata]